jgi:hypothetical protein
MFLAEALIERKVLSNQINDLAMLIEDNATIQEGDEVPDIAKMLVDLHAMHEQHARLDKEIRITNANTDLHGISLMEAIAERDALKFKASTFGNLVGRGYGRSMTRRMFRKSASEVRFTDLLNRNKMAELRDAYAKSSRELDAQIQAKNWSVQLFD